MPRGAIAKRSAKPVAGGGGPAVATPLLAFPNVATMAAYDTTAFVDGAEAEVETLAGLFLLDKSSALAVTPTTVVNATGGGQWLRQDIASLRWQNQAGWWINPATGNDEAIGSLIAPVKTFKEIQIRMGQGPLVNCTIEFLADSAENVVYEWNSAGTVEIVGISSTSFAGVISAAQNANAATPVAANITAAALPVSWTASGLVGKIGVLTSGASNGFIFVVSRDLGAKTARITQPATGAIPFATGPFINGNTFDMQILTRLTGVWRITSQPGKLVFGFLEMFTPQVSSGDPSWRGSIVHTPTVDGSGVMRPVASSIEDGAVTGAAEMRGFASSFIQTTGVSLLIGALGTATLEESLVEGPAAAAGTTGILTDEITRIRILTYAAIYNVEDAIRLGGQSRLDATSARLFGTGVTQNGIILGAESTFNYTTGFVPTITAPATAQMNVGGMITTYALLPKLNLGNGALAVQDSGTIAIVDTFVPLAADINTAVGILPYAVVLTSVITVDGTRDIVYDVCWGIFCIGGPTQGVVALFIDGVKATTGPAYAPAAVALIVGGSLRWKSQLGGAGVRARLAAGAHTITVQWAQAGAAAQMYCRPVTQADEGESMSLTIRELVNDW